MKGDYKINISEHDLSNNFNYFKQLKEYGNVHIGTISNYIPNLFRQWLEYIEYPFDLDIEVVNDTYSIYTFKGIKIKNEESA